MKIYLCGPITGHENNNIEAFNEAHKFLSEKGYDVVNPQIVGYLNPDYSYDQCMGQDLKMLCNCDIVGVLPGWQESKGCRMEILVATSLSKTIIDAITGKKLIVLNELYFTVKESL